MSLQDSFIVFLMYLTGNFHLQFNNNIKIITVLHVYIYMFVFLQNHYDLQHVSWSSLPKYCSNSILPGSCQDPNQTVSSTIISQILRFLLHPGSHEDCCGSCRVGSLASHSCLLAAPPWEARRGGRVNERKLMSWNTDNLIGKAKAVWTSNAKYGIQSTPSISEQVFSHFIESLRLEKVS